MPCYHPITAYRALVPNPETGKFRLIFHESRAHKLEMLKIPCGQCIGCRLERSRIWAMRCVHEAQLHEDNSFVTLTYDSSRPCSLGRDYTLVPDDFVKFMKRLRKEFSNEKIRFFHCGEYGSLNMRPHHHAILFGLRLPDCELWSRNRGQPIYRSATLERLWPFGFCSVGTVTFESCAYVARYIMKKQTGEQSKGYYNGRVPEYITMSRRPGIASDWVKKYASDVYDHDYVVLRGNIKCRPARYYDDIFDKIDHDKLELVKLKRKEVNSERDKEYFNHVEQLRESHGKVAMAANPDVPFTHLVETGKIIPFVKPLLVAEEVKRLQIQKLKRPIEEVL